MAIYNATGGLSWYHNDNWLTGNIKDWYGVDVIGERVIHLSLNGNNLRGTLPAEINDLTALTSLNLGSNQLTGTIDFVKNMPDLITLTLAFNQFSGSIPAKIGLDTSLIDLNLGYNSFSGKIPKEIGNLSRLKYLSLQNNQLIDSIPEEICHLDNLHNLFLGNNQLSGSLPEYIGNLTSLADFQINNNQFSGNLPASISEMSGLYSFQIDNNLFEGAVPPGIGALTNLLYLNINDNLFTSLPDELALLKQLESINASNNRLKTIPSTIDSLTNLKSLDLSYNELDSLPSEIGNCIRINNLTFNDISTSHVIPGQANTLYYNYQGNVPLDEQEVVLSVHDSLHLDIRQISELSHADNLYTWYKNSSYFSEGPVLELQDVSNEDEGEYYCSIENSTYTVLTLNTDSILVKIGNSADNLYDTIVSDKTLCHAFFNDTVTLVTPDNIRGAVVWQASLDSVEWFDLNPSDNEPEISQNVLSVNAEKVVLIPREPAAYRYRVSEENCPPMFSDTAMISVKNTEMLLDTVVNVSDSTVLISLPEIEILLPQFLAEGDFRLTIEKINTPPRLPLTVFLRDRFLM